MITEFNTQEFWEEYHTDMVNYCKERIATKTKQLRTHCKSRKSSKHLRASIERYIEDLLRAKIALDKLKH
jgi:hypothetical protein